MNTPPPIQGPTHQQQQQMLLLQQPTASQQQLGQQVLPQQMLQQPPMLSPSLKPPPIQQPMLQLPHQLISQQQQQQLQQHQLHQHQLHQQHLQQQHLQQQQLHQQQLQQQQMQQQQLQQQQLQQQLLQQQQLQQQQLHQQQLQQLHQQQLQQQQQPRMNPIPGMAQQPFTLHAHHLAAQHLQQPQQYVHRSPMQQPLAQQSPVQLQHLPQHLQQQQQQPHLPQQHVLTNPQPHFLQQQQPQQHQQLFARQQSLSPQLQQGPLQPPQLPHQQLQPQQLQPLQLQPQQLQPQQLQPQQLQPLHVQPLQPLHVQQPLVHPQQQQEDIVTSASHGASPVGSSRNSGSSSSSSVSFNAAPGLPSPPLSTRQGTCVPPQGMPQPQGAPATIILAAAPMEAVQIAARPGSASTVADLVREAMEAAESAGKDSDAYGAVREADEGFGEDDLLDFTEDIAALMEAFLSPTLAVAAQTLELTVQLALDFVDDLVEKGLEHHRQQQEGSGRSPGPRRIQPQLVADDLLLALRSHPRKALRCREALENYRLLEEFKCAFPEDKYLSAPAQSQSPVLPRAHTTPGSQHSGPNPTQSPMPQDTLGEGPQRGQTPARNEASHGLPMSITPSQAVQGDCTSPAIRTQHFEAAYDCHSPVKTAAALDTVPLNI